MENENSKKENGSAPMEKESLQNSISTFLRGGAFQRLLVAICAGTLIAILFIICVFPVRYDLTPGAVSPVDIKVTDSTWEDPAATKQRREEAESRVKTTFIRDESITTEILEQFETIVKALNQITNVYVPSLAGYTTGEFTPEDIQGARALLTVPVPESETGETAEIVQLSSYQLERLMREDPSALKSMYSALRKKISNAKITEGNEAEDITALVDESYAYSPLDDKTLFTQIGRPILKACVQPNYVIDHEKLEAEKEAARDAVDPVIYKFGQIIIHEGETVTQEQYDLLNAHSTLRGGSLNRSLYLGSLIMCAALLVCTCILLHIAVPSLAGDTQKTTLCALICVLTFAVCAGAERINTLLCPVLLSAILLTAMTGIRSGLIMNTILSLLCAILFVNSGENNPGQSILFTVCSISSGALCVAVMRGKHTRLRALVCLPPVIVCDAVLTAAFCMITDVEMRDGLILLAWLTGGAVCASLLALALQPLLEMLFNLPTPYKLMELSNPNHPLLRRLLLEAPGTYHHSLIVANLSEASAEAIGADPLLARVGGYYHDVGKLKRPLFFKENQTGDENAHDHTDPQVSAAILTAHPGDGVEIARKYRLPKAILQIIGSHHGNTAVMYFYHKALQQAGGKPVDISRFRYSAETPSTKECAVIMICDTVEAAVRSMKSPTSEEVDAFIRKLIRQKLEDGQLDRTPLTLKDLDLIRESCVTVLTGVFHERIEYPTMPDTAAGADPAPAAEVKESAAPEQESLPAEAEKATELPEAKEVSVQESANGILVVAPKPESPLPPLEMPEDLNGTLVVDDLLKGPSLTETAEIPDSVLAVNQEESKE